MAILAGDVGGTKTHLALFKKGEVRHWIFDQKYKSANYNGFFPILEDFMSRCKEPIEAACFGAAGPIQNNRGYTTYLSWLLDGKEIASQTKIPKVWVINDLLANAYGINSLNETEFFVLNKGKNHPGNRAIIAAGTGLGESYTTGNGGNFTAFPSEGGHCSFAPGNELEIELLFYLKKQYDHVSFERVLSGDGLVHLYHFFLEKKIHCESQEVKEAFKIKDPAQVITEMGLKKACPLCCLALNSFVEIYGSEAGNLALKILATGGLYIGGGIAPKILNAFKEGNFIKRFIQKGRFSNFLKDIPVKVILNEKTAIFGAAYLAQHSITRPILIDNSESFMNLSIEPCIF